MTTEFTLKTWCFIAHPKSNRNWFKTWVPEVKTSFRKPWSDSTLSRKTWRSPQCQMKIKISNFRTRSLWKMNKWTLCLTPKPNSTSSSYSKIRRVLKRTTKLLLRSKSLRQNKVCSFLLRTWAEGMWQSPAWFSFSGEANLWKNMLCPRSKQLISKCLKKKPIMRNFMSFCQTWVRRSTV